MSKYDTNLASEFYVLSMLYRKGFEAYLTLGSKKAVDIVVQMGREKLVTIDVKGLAGTTGWPVDNLKRARGGHFLVFVSFRGRIDDPRAVPEVYVVPSREVRHLVYKAPGGRRLVRLSRLRTRGRRYSDAWHLLGAEPSRRA